jgi:hypothetical protein
MYESESLFFIVHAMASLAHLHKFGEKLWFKQHVLRVYVLSIGKGLICMHMDIGRFPS